MMPFRKHNETAYKYGFNDKENDLEDNLQDYGMRMYDVRLGRFISEDPISDWYPWYSPYQFAGNKPIWAIDLDGLEEFEVHDKMQNGKLWRIIEKKKNVGSDEVGKIQYQSVDGTIGEIINVSQTNQYDQAMIAHMEKIGKIGIGYEPNIKVKKQQDVKKEVSEHKPSHKKTDKTGSDSDHTQEEQKKEEKKPPFLLDTPIAVDIAFETEKDVFLKGQETICKDEIKKIVINLISNPGYEARLDVGVGYEKEQKDAITDPTLLMGKRIKVIQDYIDKIAPPGFDKSRITLIPVYKSNTKTTIKYKSKPKFL